MCLCMCEDRQINYLTQIKLLSGFWIYIYIFCCPALLYAQKFPFGLRFEKQGLKWQCFCIVLRLSSCIPLETLEYTRMEEGDSHFSGQSLITFSDVLPRLKPAETWHTFKLPGTDEYRNEIGEKSFSVSFWISNYMVVLSETPLSFKSLGFLLELHLIDMLCTPRM